MNLVWKIVHFNKASSLKFDILDHQQKFLLRVVATQLPKPGLFKPILSSLFESRDEIPFKGGSVKHPKIFKFLQILKNHKNFLKKLFYYV